jgi:LmbE family N-acetylglucosaminyl deacetylase
MLSGWASLAGATTLGLPLVGSLTSEEPPRSPNNLKIVVVGGHPDDPQSSCGGTMARYADLGHEVVALFLTRGELAFPDRPPQENAALFTREAANSCEILKARPLYANQIDADTEINKKRYEGFRKLLDAEHPDLVFTHWPIDRHRDHRAASLLAYDAWLESGKKFDLYYYEVETGSESQSFLPNLYVDITATESRKRASCYAFPEVVKDFYPLHEQMQRFRGVEVGVKSAEAYFHLHEGGSLAPPRI